MRKVVLSCLTLEQGEPRKDSVKCLGFFPLRRAICCQHSSEYLLLLLLSSQTWLFRIPPTHFWNKSFCIDRHTATASQPPFSPKRLYITVTHLPWSNTAALQGEERKKEELSYKLETGQSPWGVQFLHTDSESTDGRGQQWGLTVTSCFQKQSGLLKTQCRDTAKHNLQFCKSVLHYLVITCLFHDI